MDHLMSEALKAAAQDVLDQFRDDPDQPTMVTKAILIVEAIGLDGDTGTLQIATKAPLWDLLGLLETGRISLVNRIAQLTEDGDE